MLGPRCEGGFGLDLDLCLSFVRVQRFLFSHRGVDGIHISCINRIAEGIARRGCNMSQSCEWARLPSIPDDASSIIIHHYHICLLILRNLALVPFPLILEGLRPAIKVLSLILEDLLLNEEQLEILPVVLIALLTVRTRE